MKRNWKKRSLLLLLTGILGGSTAVWSAFSDRVFVQNRITVGDVDIQLSEKELQDGREVAYQDPKLIFPGDTVSKIPMVKNLAADCWIRARIRYRKNTEDLEGFSDEDLDGFSKKWVKQGEYFYYKEVLKTGASVDMFHAVKVPEEWTEEHAGQKLEIDIQADAIQAKNFQPDFQALSPWGNHPIELCVHTAGQKTVARKEQTANVVEFNGTAHRLLAVPDDFFAGFGAAMPGDTLSGTAQVANTTKKTAEIFFHTEAEKGDPLHNALLQKLELVISMNGKQLYQGPLQANALSKDISLVKLKSGEKGKMDFTVLVPKELNNTYALSQTDVKWVFSVQEEDTKTQPETDPQPEVREYPGSQSSPVKTEDDLQGETWICILLAAFMTFLFGITYQRGA